MIPALEALNQLRAGNQRFVSGQRTTPEFKPSRPPAEIPEQRPFAIVIGCSDARVPAELIFDQGLGDLFVIRVAGNIVAPSQIGSVEFCADRFGTQLVMVLGHTFCGAVEATLAELEQAEEQRSPNLAAIVDRIRPGIEPVVSDQAPGSDLLQAAVRANVLASVAALRSGSSIIEGLIAERGLRIVGAEYSLATGLVDVFETGGLE